MFATFGALTAIHKGFDIVGIAILATVTALGGGVVRDLIIGDAPSAAFTNDLSGDPAGRCGGSGFVVQAFDDALVGVAAPS